MRNPDLPKLLRAMADASEAKERGTNVIFADAADRLDELEATAAWNFDMKAAEQHTVIIYREPQREGKYPVGLAYRSVSNNWHNVQGGFGQVYPEAWIPLPKEDY